MSIGGAGRGGVDPLGETELAFGGGPQYGADPGADRESAARGSLTANYSPSRRILTWRLSYSGLSGPITWAEFRGPDIEGTDSAIVPINLPLEGNPHPGAATLTDQQAHDLEAGRWYVVVKTERFPAGELRGPLTPTR